MCRWLHGVCMMIYSTLAVKYRFYFPLTYMCAILNSFTGTRAFLFVEPGNVLGVVGVCGRWPKEKYDFASARAAAKSIAADNENALVFTESLLVCTVLDDGQLSCESRTSAGSYASVDITGADGKCCPSSLAETAMLCRVKASLSLSFQFAANETGKSCQSLAEEFGRVHDKLSSDRSAFFIDSTLVTRNADSATSIGDLRSGSGQQRGQNEAIVPIQQSFQVSSAKEENHVPIVATETCVGERIHLLCPLDAMLLVRKSTSAPRLHSLCTSALTSQLSLLRSKLESSIQSGASLCTHRPYHFNLPHSPHHTATVFYPNRSLGSNEVVDEGTLESTRRELHHRFNLPMNMPLLRKHMTLGAQQAAGGYLTNVHNGLNLSSNSGGEVSLVQGVYAYHHYMQDRFNDDGWGCAYRSLQTLWSWFKLQGYTGLDVPSHRDIQQALVDVEDKPPKFVGSRQWIGSIEVQTVLNQLMQVESRILFVMNGASMASHAREIAMHLRQQGTPIMIGGGTLAHTIIGIDFNDRTGDVRYLILDPHYTGGEDIGIIHAKGWCGWKSNSFWDKQAHYNMCMPLRPDII
eukprot:scpid36068/ scgid1230/ Ufm1-specific protease 2